MKNLLKALVALLLVFALVACSTANNGGNNNNEPNNGNDNETPVELAQGVTDTEVLVANCAGTSGALATVGVPFNAGIEAYFKMINAEGGVNGRQIKFIHQDDEADPTKAITCAQSMVEDEKVFGFVGHFGTGSIVATYDYISEQGV
ncbi:MAG: ABC transporter substrate-binding protein, partial [Erysipelothrix sp.]|nr:ABC transporter substrate-binding protein [Erysipelothrix sp.]